VADTENSRYHDITSKTYFHKQAHRAPVKARLTFQLGDNSLSNPLTGTIRVSITCNSALLAKYQMQFESLNRLKRREFIGRLGSAACCMAA
jgi:hypothetical protein